MIATWVPRRNVWIVAGCLFLGASFRLGALFYPRAIDGDEVRYLSVAHHLHDGTGYQNWWGPETHVHPLHPLLLSLSSATFDSLFRYGKGVAAVASWLLLLPLAALARSLGGEEAGLFLLLLASFNSWMVRSAGWAQPENLYALCVACALILLVSRTNQGTAWGGWCAAGLLFGLAYLSRPEGLSVGLLALALAALMTHSGSWRNRLLQTLAGTAVLVLVCLPFVFYLRHITGSWMVTGKSEDIFFRAQVEYLLGGQRPDPGTFLAARSHFEGILPYTLAHPSWVLDRAGRNLLLELFLLFRGLGAAGIFGLLAWAKDAARGAWRGRAKLFLVSPFLTFFLLLFAFPNERLVGSFLPFCLVFAALGWSSIWGRLRSTGLRRRSLAVPLFVLLLAAGWAVPAARLIISGKTPEATVEQLMAGEVLRNVGAPDQIATNTSVLAFYARDPRLFGAPGSYRPLPSSLNCPDLVREMRARGAALALMELGQFQLPVEISAGCPLRPLAPSAPAVPQRSLAAYRLEGGVSAPIEMSSTP